MLQLHSQTKITQFYDPTLRKEEIIRFDVLSMNLHIDNHSVHNAAIVEVIQSQEGAARNCA